MVVIKCKMCGGDISVTEGQTLAVCDYCGCTVTLPKVSEEQRAIAFNRANHFRKIGEYDKALAAYETILKEDETDAEAHWCCALCRFGIDYVTDPTTNEWVPTCNRMSYDNFMDDVDYLAAVSYSDGSTSIQYQKDAEKIAEVQRGILAVSNTAEPFDVFICYKELDEHGERTRDSVLAQEIYYQLAEQGYKVFFSRITLEDKVGTEYEPYIFSALNSAKVMLVIGSKPEYLNAVWVKNEWSRFLKLMKKDKTKLLLPCYKDMDPYDFPEELSILQAYDMNKIGFMQDLIRGIEKILHSTEKQAEEKKESVGVQYTGDINQNALLKRGFMALEDGEWERANDFFEKVLNMDAECGEAYVGEFLSKNQQKNLNKYADACIRDINRAAEEKVMACTPDKNSIEKIVKKYALGEFYEEKKIREALRFDLSYRSNLPKKKNLIKKQSEIFQKDRLWNRAIHFSQGEMSSQLKETQRKILESMEKSITETESRDRDIINKIKSEYRKFLEKKEAEIEQEFQNITAVLEERYQKCCEAEQKAEYPGEYKRTAERFDKLVPYKDSSEHAEYCRNAAKEIAEMTELREKQKREEQYNAAYENQHKKEKRRKFVAISISAVLAVIIVICGVKAYIWYRELSMESLINRLSEETLSCNWVERRGDDRLYYYYTLRFNDDGTLKYYYSETQEALDTGERPEFVGEFPYQIKSLFGEYTINVNGESFTLELDSYRNPESIEYVEKD